MSSSSLLLILCTCIVTAHAFSAISVPAVVAAGSDFVLSITAGTDDASYTSYRVYLDTMPPGYTGGPSCWFLNSTIISTTTLNLTIPADLGSDGDFYSVATREFPPVDSDKYTYSGNFNLIGATGNWSEYENELNGAPIWPADDLPCDAYSCARACAMASFPSDLTSGSNAANTMKACIMNCPGVSTPISTSSYATGSSTVTGAGSTGTNPTAASSTGTAAQSTGAGSSGRTSATATGTLGDSASQTSGAGAAATSKGVAPVNLVSIPLLAVGGILALIL